MTSPDGFDPGFARPAMWAALVSGVLTTLAFAAAMVAVPLAGPYCPGDCRPYPYTDTLDLFPHDYLWMPLAMLATLAFVYLTLVIDSATLGRRRLASRSAFAAALIAAVPLLIAYAVQLLAVPASQAAGETEGVAFFSMYNGHGMFIALEELGYGMMSLAFLGLALALPKGARWIAAARLILAAGFVLPLVGLIAYLAAFGLALSYRYEVFIIGIDWTALILASALMAAGFRRM